MLIENLRLFCDRSFRRFQRSILFRVSCFLSTPLRRRRPSDACIPVANRQAYLPPQKTATASPYERSHRVKTCLVLVGMHSTSSMSVRVGGGTHPTHVTSTVCLLPVTERDDDTCMSVLGLVQQPHRLPQKQQYHCCGIRYACNFACPSQRCCFRLHILCRDFSVCMHVRRQTLVLWWRNAFRVHVPKSARRNKLQLIREREAVKARLGRLQTMLLQKLTHKYGSKRWAQRANYVSSRRLH